MRNIFLEKSYTKCGGETIPRSFFEKQKEVWNFSPCLIFCMIFEAKYFSCYILLPDQISLSGCPHFVRY